MSHRRAFLCGAAVAALLALVWSDGTAREPYPTNDASLATDPSGAPASGRPAPRTVPIADPSLDDLLRPRNESRGTAVPSDRSLDVLPPLPFADAPIALWQWLSGIEPARRGDATLELEPGVAARAAELAAMRDVSAAWNRGEHTRAIEMLRVREEAGARWALVVQWKPDAGLAAKSGGGDVRLGGARTGAQQASLDFDLTTGHLCCVTRWGSTDGPSAWTVNFSADDGATWTESASYASSVGIVDVSATAIAGYCYVGYVVGNDRTHLRMRRYHMSDGGSDLPYGFQYAIDAGTDTLTDVAVVSNAEDFGNRVYAFAIQDDHVLRYVWDAANDGTTFTDGGSPAVANAEAALDASWVNGYDCSAFLLVSYVGTDGQVHVQRRDAGAWTDVALATGASVVRPTSVTAYGTVLVCAYEYPFPEGRGIRYSISYDCGSNWNMGVLAQPDGVTATSYMAPDVDARDGLGTGITYGAEVGEPDPVFYQVRQGFAPGAWSERMAFNDHDDLTGTPTTLAHLPRLSPHALSHGAVYFGVGGVPYFDYPGAGVVDAAPRVPASRVALRVAGANPTSGAATIELAVPAAGRVGVRVFDVAGACVRLLADGEHAAGTHRLTWDGARDDGTTLGEGVYFVVARSATGHAVTKLVRLR